MPNIVERPVVERQIEFGYERTYCNGYTRRVATFSWNLKHRWSLHIKWNDNGKSINFLMLNPSTADEMKNDPTVERCEKRARSWGFGGVIITNLFALRATDPKHLYTTDDPVGEFNNNYIGWAAVVSEVVVCAWGQHGKFQGRDIDVRRFLNEQMMGDKLYYLKLSNNGIPHHPLYLSYDLELKEWW